MPKSEHRIQDEIRQAVSAQCPGVIFRANAGSAWQGDRVWSKEFGQYVLKNLRPYKGLPKGFSDTVYFGPAADTVFLEIKDAKGKTSEEQDRFLALMKSYGHSTAVVRSAEDAVAYINNPNRRGLPMINFDKLQDALEYIKIICEEQQEKRGCAGCPLGSEDGICRLGNCPLTWKPRHPEVDGTDRVLG